MGGKTSKAIDIFVPENCKYCELSDEALKKYSGGPYEYMAVDVCLNFSNTKGIFSAFSFINFGV